MGHIGKFVARDIAITIPKSTRWEDYEEELAAARAGEVLNFKVRQFPRTEPGRRCYVVHDGAVRGWMHISGLSEKAFTCTTTGKRWEGKFIERTGEFHPLEEPVPMKGFMGFRYIEEELN